MEPTPASPRRFRDDRRSVPLWASPPLLCQPKPDGEAHFVDEPERDMNPTNPSVPSLEAPMPRDTQALALGCGPAVLRHHLDGNSRVLAAIGRAPKGLHLSAEPDEPALAGLYQSPKNWSVRGEGGSIITFSNNTHTWHAVDLVD